MPVLGRHIEARPPIHSRHFDQNGPGIRVTLSHHGRKCPSHLDPSDQGLNPNIGAQCNHVAHDGAAFTPRQAMAC
jgi:hypothetical protein